MPEDREDEDFYDVLIDPIDQPVFPGDSPGIDVPVVSFQLFNLTGPRFGMFADFLQSEKTIWYISLFVDHSPQIVIHAFSVGHPMDIALLIFRDSFADLRVK